jgi:hypothetical protein
MLLPTVSQVADPLELGGDVFRRHAVTVIGDLGPNDDIRLVPMQHHVDVMGVGIEAVPDEFDHGPHRIVLVGELLDVIVASFESIRLHARILPGGTDMRSTVALFSSTL